MLQFMGLQKVRHDLLTEQQQNYKHKFSRQKINKDIVELTTPSSN